jgi:hypothetical protein
VLRRADFETERREIERYLDLAACEGEDRERALSLAGGEDYEVTLGWYLLAKPSLL